MVAPEHELRERARAQVEKDRCVQLHLCGLGPGAVWIRCHPEPFLVLEAISLDLHGSRPTTGG